ncbi:Sensor histidine kinase RcsC [Methylobacterium crusticola]|uniref:histidine kinase n=1 Tax=Methylobacterium crusticola TaxID=1697972 RepID=A0ABQ4R5S7_9HYPH|nr:PAS domain-containing protein [Methylobacterium crusticola]GJD52802.1 Sensor histidine kinase RcsC [Methylobacterium crusticola]
MSVPAPDSGAGHAIAADILAVSSIAAVPTILEVVCRTTGMGFAAVARVTEDRWVACQVRDDIAFGLQPGGELRVETTLCREIRRSGTAVVIDNVSEDAVYCGHPTPALYGFASYISMPIVLPDGTFFGTLCAIDPRPARLNTPETVGMFKLFADLIAFHLNAHANVASSEEVRRSAAFVTGILAASPDGVNVLSADGRLEFMNARGVALNQLDSDEAVLGRPFADLWPEAERGKVQDAMARAAAGEIARIEGFGPTARGEPRWWEVSFASFRPDGTGPLKLVAISRDISERVEAGAALRESAATLRELNETLEERVDARTRDLLAAEEALRQSQKMEAVGQLTGGVAHDFNNLLTIIRSSVDFLRRPELPEARKRRYLDAVSDTVDRAAKLTGQLLAFARRQTLRPEVFEVGARLRAVADMLDTVTGARIRVVTQVPEALCFVRADLSQFETALVNMAVNARDAMAGEGTLTLRLTCADAMPPIRGHAGARGPFAAVSLADTGSGIAPEHVGRIFEPFFTTKEVGRGTGLGLSQVFGFAKQSGGDVAVESRPGRGTTFTLYLPEIEPEAHTERPAVDDALSPVGSGQRVLVVEDNVEVGRFATQILQDLGYATVWAVNAEDALDRLGPDGGGFEAVFSDVVMPGMGGIALAKELRQRLPGLPVVLASGYSHVLAQEGAHGFELLHKPYSAEQLGRILRRAVAPR